MFLKAAFKYQLADTKKPMIVFYCVLLALFMLMAVGFVLSSADGSARLNGAEIASCIFLFIAGLNSFKEPFLMLSQNSISRRSIYKSHLLLTLVVALIMAVADMLILLCLRLLAANKPNFECTALFEQAFVPFMNGNGFLLYFNLFVFNLLLYIFVFALGYMITILFYRLNKAGKIAVGAGVPVLLFIVLPALDATLLKSTLSRALLNLLKFMFSTPYAAMVSFAAATVISSILAWLLMRKAQ